MDNVSEWIVLFRIGERITLSIIVVIVSIVVMIAFWRSIQKIDFQMSREKIGAGGSVVLGTPVFVLLALVGYAFVSLSNPISVEISEDRKSPKTVDLASNHTKTSSFVGVTSDGGSGGGSVVNNLELERLRAVERVMSLNCLAGEADETSARVQDDLATVKLQLLEPVWSEQWGNFETFAAWALGRSREVPHPGALAVFQETHQIC